ncbi:hypothetical protein C449_04822 [Halococcus saccharolyticus DSM 5350]|uniref:DUF7123 domain-containing protein n=1 Tax=Halococcus saccharolyticus DSM 5350 TaxID=1227455 RepID=M0MMQ9_9EURY|nr:hypothetical protein C449_04822 [Halococcus saccharolyticus DSM 5350]
MTNLTRQVVRAYLEQQADSEPTYFKAHEIADDIGETPQAVAQHLQRLQTELTGMTLEQWGHSKNITWLVQKEAE